MTDEAEAPRAASRWTVNAALVTLALVWLAFLLRVPLHSFAFLVLVVVLLVARAWRTAALVVALSPPVVMAVLAVVMFARGTARLLYVGLPSTGFHNPDRQTRLPRETMGDLVSGDEWLAILPNNLAILALARTFGPMPGSYTGPYPDRSATFAALEHAWPISAARLMEDVVALDGREIPLDPGVGRQLVRNLSGWKEPAVFDSGSFTDRPEAALVEERCLILRLPADPGVHREEQELWEHLLAYHAPDGPAAVVALVDVERGRPFAYYAPASGPGPRYPPVPWRRRE